MAQVIAMPLLLLYFMVTFRLSIFHFFMFFLFSLSFILAVLHSHAQEFGKTIVHEFHFFYIAILNGTWFFHSHKIDLVLVGSAIELNTIIIIIDV